METMVVNSSGYYSSLDKLIWKNSLLHKCVKQFEISTIDFPNSTGPYSRLKVRLNRNICNFFLQVLLTLFA